MFKSLKSHRFPLFLITFLIILLTRHIWGTRAWIETHDGIFHVIRIEAFVAGLKSGLFPVRWAGNLDNGFGLPLFNFVYPLPYYLGSPLLLLGMSSKWVIKILGITAYALGGYGYYLLGQRRNKNQGILAALIFLLTPYILVNLFVRGALGELFALSFFPWALYLLLIQKQNSLQWYHPLGVALMILSHNFLGFLMLPIWGLIGFFEGVSLKKIVLTLIFALSLTAFFVLPMIFERNLIHSGSGSDYTYNYADHYIYPSQLFYSPWGLGHSVAGPLDGFSLEIGIPHILLLIVGLSFITVSNLYGAWIYFLITILAIFLMLPLSHSVWQVLVPLQIMQFPWRLLGIIACTTPLIYSAIIFTKIQQKITTIILIVTLPIAYYYSIPFYYQNNEQFATQLYIHRDKTTTSSRTELLPKWAPAVERWLPNDQIKIGAGNASLQILRQDATNLSFRSSTNDIATTFVISRNYFPNWIAELDTGNKLTVTPTDDGELLIHALPGDHLYQVYVGSTELEKIGDLISFFAFCYIIYLAIKYRQVRQ